VRVPDPRLLRTLLVFALGGALLFGLEQGVRDPRAELSVIRMSAAELDALRGEAARQLGRGPTQGELQAWIDTAVTDEMLYREALARGWAESDPVVRRRLLRNMTFVGGSELDSDALLREARALGLDRSDVVVRRRLIQRMRLALADAAASALPEPSDAELVEFRAAKPESFSGPAAVAFSHVFFARDELRAAELLAELQSVEAPVAAAAGAGDPFVVGRDVSATTRDDIATLFGAEFADAVLAAPLGQWSGPLRSSHGTHLVFVRDRVGAQGRSLAAVRAAFRAEQVAQSVQRSIEELRALYDVELDSTNASQRGSSQPPRSTR
jgi:hypothetical protein